MGEKIDFILDFSHPGKEVVAGRSEQKRPEQDRAIKDTCSLSSQAPPSPMQLPLNRLFRVWVNIFIM